MAWLCRPEFRKRVRDKGLNYHRMESLQLLVIGVGTIAVSTASFNGEKWTT